MLNKKRQELIIQNLNSISAEVRIKSIEQLLNLPGISSEEKSGYIQKLVADPEEEVRAAAAAAVQHLTGGSPAMPAEPVQARPAMTFDLPSATSSAPVAPVAPIADLPLPSLDSIEKPLETLSQPAADIGLAGASLPPAPRNTAFVDDPLDPSLPDVKKINDIPTLLDHIKWLSTNKPSGYRTQMLQLAASSLEEVALTALQALFNLKDESVSSPVLTMLADEQYSSQRRFLMLKIIMEGDQDLDCALLQEILMKERDVIVKSGLVKVFARSSRESGIPTLILCLEDGDPRVRANTVEVIEEQNITGCEQKIIQLLQDPENRVKVNAAKYLVKKGFQQAFLTLRSMLVSPEVWLRDSVIFALGEIGDQASLTLLKAALKDPNQGIRLSVLKALARINNNTSRQVLKAACQDPDPVVAQVAASLFDKIKDTPLREEIRPAAQMQTPAALPAAPVPTGPAKPSVPIPASAPARPTMPAPAQATTQTPAPAVQRSAPVLPAVPIMPSSPLPSAEDIEPTPETPVKTPPVQPPAASPVHTVSAVPPAVARPASPTPSAPPVSSVPVRPVMPPSQPPAAVPPSSQAGQPAFAKPRSAEIYARLCSADVNEQRAGARDIAFVMGDDQNILLAKAIVLADESIRIGAVKILSRKKTSEAKDMLQKLSGDTNETVRSMAEKALQLLK